MTTGVLIGKTGYTNVLIHTQRVSENWVSSVEKFNRARTKETYDLGYIKYIINLLQLTRTIEVIGWIATAQGYGTADQIKENLKNLIKSGGTVDILYNGELITGALLGLDIREVAADRVTPAFYMVTFSLMEGVQR